MFSGLWVLSMVLKAAAVLSHVISYHSLPRVRVLPLQPDSVVTASHYLALSPLRIQAYLQRGSQQAILVSSLAEKSEC